MAWTYVEPAHFKKDYFPDVLGPKGSCEKDKVQYSHRAEHGAAAGAPPESASDEDSAGRERRRHLRRRRERRRRELRRRRKRRPFRFSAGARSAGAASEGPCGSRRARGAGRAKSERDAGGDGVATVVDSPSVHLIRHRP